jgi:LysM repeat protein
MFEQTLDVEHLFGHDRAMHRTVVRRRRLALLVGISVVAAVATGPVAHAFSGPEHRPPVTNYVVGAGDTLWDIAHRANPTSDPRVLIDQIQRLNGLTDASLVPGQRLTIPAS